MQNWYQIFPRNTGLSVYAWIAFCVLPFYFILRSSSLYEVMFGILMVIMFFISYRLSFISKGWVVYLSVMIETIISVIMILYFVYVYFSLFLSFFIGNIKDRVRFWTLYVIHLLTTVITVSVGFFTKTEMFFAQLPFIVISVLGVIVLPISMYNRNKQEKLEGELEVANKKISQLIVLEERQRIARDLHDTLGQKLSLIGLKTDLAGKLIEKDPKAARQEMIDVRQTASTALKEVREMVADMRGVRLVDEIARVKEIMDAAQMNIHLEGTPKLQNTPLLVESVLSMCLKEAITNVIKHSKASNCKVSIQQLSNEVVIRVQDDGVGLEENAQYQGTGLQGMRERLDFVNGSFEISQTNGTLLKFSVPTVIQQTY
ncbi:MULTISPECIES: sensor histidine kinase [Paraliobacillus]|uniref:sensor histidine kinase n=1 Tax=Paraliobacillus TaxID=200903 RepID=UPI000DD30C75|nr:MULTISPECIES: sensor histidine kinase [Paraliobacillus]